MLTKEDLFSKYGYLMRHFEQQVDDFCSQFAVGDIIEFCLLDGTPLVGKIVSIQNNHAEAEYDCGTYCGTYDVWLAIAKKAKTC